MIHRYLRAVNDNLLDVVGAERTLLLHQADGVECGVVAADAGIELQGDAHGLPDLAEILGQSFELEAVVGAREGGAEATVFALQHIQDAGEAAFGQQRAVEARLRGAAGVHAFDHGAVLRGHQAGGLGAGDAQRVHGFIDVEFEAACGTRGGGEHAKRGA